LHFRAPVALKCLKIPEELSKEERSAFLEQFRSEAEIMFRLSAVLSNIVRPLHVDAINAPEGQFVPLMALEWLEGKSFEKLIEERTFRGQDPLSLEEVVGLLGPAALALDQAHSFEQLQVVHRDIKPDNLFVCTKAGEPMVKILDFGISKVQRSASQLAGHFSQTSGQAPFSPAYGAPEQWVPKRYGQTGPWTDVWGLALTMVEIIKGDAVIVGDHQAMMGTALDPKVRPTPRTEGVEVSDEVEQVFHKALAVDPRYRYQTLRDFWDALRRAMDYGGAQSQSKIRVPKNDDLPPMSAPTPWTPPGQSRGGAPAHQSSVPGLPPMLAPAPLEPSTAGELSMEALFPHQPSSAQRPPVRYPSSPARSERFELAIDPEDVPPPPSRSRSEARRSDPTRALDIEIELEETTLPPPPPPRPSDPHGTSQELADDERLSLVPSTPKVTRK
jgi:serine/threonine-protein kinase